MEDVCGVWSRSSISCAVRMTVEVECVGGEDENVVGVVCGRGRALGALSGGGCSSGVVCGRKLSISFAVRRRAGGKWRSAEL